MRQCRVIEVFSIAFPTADRARVAALKPPVHIFGHVHPSYGTRELDGTRFYNAALCDGEGGPVNAPHVIDL